ncbi:6748_t:CDS:1, partial [Racocetra fulgida]
MEEHIIPIPPETKESNDRETNIKNHRESIDRIFVSQYMKDTGNTYIVTYSEKCNSILGWSVDNIENDGQQEPDEFY